MPRPNSVGRAQVSCKPPPLSIWPLGVPLTAAHPCSSRRSFRLALGRGEAVAPLHQVFQQAPVHLAIHPGADPATVADIGRAKESNLVDQELLKTIRRLHRDGRTAMVKLKHGEGFLPDAKIGMPPGLDFGNPRE